MSGLHAICRVRCFCAVTISYPKVFVPKPLEKSSTVLRTEAWNLSDAGDRQRAVPAAERDRSAAGAGSHSAADQPGVQRVGCARCLCRHKRTLAVHTTPKWKRCLLFPTAVILWRLVHLRHAPSTCGVVQLKHPGRSLKHISLSV